MLSGFAGPLQKVRTRKRLSFFAVMNHADKRKSVGPDPSRDLGLGRATQCADALASYGCRTAIPPLA